MQLVNIIHNLLKDLPANFHQFAISDCQHRCRSRRIIHNAQISKTISIGQSSLFFTINFDLTHSLEYNIVSSTFIPLLKNIVIPVGTARLHLFDKAIDFDFVQLRKDEMFLQCLLNLDNIIDRYLRLFVIINIVLHIDLLIRYYQSILTPSLLTWLSLDHIHRTLRCLRSVSVAIISLWSTSSSFLF